MVVNDFWTPWQLGAQVDSNPQPPEKEYEYQMTTLGGNTLVQDYSWYPDIKSADIELPAKVVWLNQGEIIAGSAMSHAVNSAVTPEDIDIYFHSYEDVTVFLSQNTNITIPKPLNENSICGNVYLGGAKLNLIWGIPYENSSDLISRFDIKACSIAYDPNAKKVFWISGAMKDCRDKKITMNLNPRSVSVQRILKYVAKGFGISNYQRSVFAELVKLGFHSHELELTTGYGANNGK